MGRERGSGKRRGRKVSKPRNAKLQDQWGKEEKHGVCSTSDAADPPAWRDSIAHGVASFPGASKLRIRTNYDVVGLGKRCANAGSSDLGES